MSNSPIIILEIGVAVQINFTSSPWNFEVWVNFNIFFHNPAFALSSWSPSSPKSWSVNIACASKYKLGACTFDLIKISHLLQVFIRSLNINLFLTIIFLYLVFFGVSSLSNENSCSIKVSYWKFSIRNNKKLFYIIKMPRYSSFMTTTSKNGISIAI